MIGLYKSHSTEGTLFPHSSAIHWNAIGAAGKFQFFTMCHVTLLPLGTMGGMWTIRELGGGAVSLEVETLKPGDCYRVKLHL